jgi:hypothetical protein
MLPWVVALGLLTLLVVVIVRRATRKPAPVDGPPTV